MGILKSKDFNKIIEWDFLIILSALIGFSNTLNYLELDDLITYYLKDLTILIEQDFIRFTIFLAVVIFLLRMIISINVIVIILCSTLIPLVAQSAINPWIIVFAVLMLSETSTNRITTSYLLLFFELIDDNKGYWRMTFLQFAMHFVKVGAIIASIPLWRNLGLM